MFSRFVETFSVFFLLTAFSSAQMIVKRGPIASAPPLVCPGTSVCDDFNRSDGGLGSNWTGSDSDITISSNATIIGGFTNTNLALYSATFSNDQYSQVVCGLTDGNVGCGPAVRVTDSSNGMFVRCGTGAGCALYKMVSGSVSFVGAYSGTI